MDNVIFIDVENEAGVQTHAIITDANGSQISMLKSTYDAQVKHLTEIPTK